MKKALYGSTALVALGALAVPAQAADPITINLGGSFAMFAGVEISSQNDAAGQPGADRRDHGLWQASDVSFSGQTTLDNGVTVGVEFQLEGETDQDQVNEAYMFYEGNFGRVEMGSIDGVAFRTSAFLPSAYFFMGPNFPSVIWGSNNNTVAQPSFSPQVNTTAFTYPGVYSFSFDNMKVNYFTPRMNGIQVGVSYMPEACEPGSRNASGATAGAQECSYIGQFTTDNNLSGSTTQSEVMEIGGNWMGSLGDASGNISIGYLSGNSENPGAANTFEDREEWAVNASFSTGPFAFGVGHRADNQGVAGDNTDTSATAVSGTYSVGSWSYGAGYIVQEQGAGAAGGEDTIDHMSIGATYFMGPGVVLMAGIDNVEYQDNADNAAGENDFTTLTVGTWIGF